MWRFLMLVLAMAGIAGGNLARGEEFRSSKGFTISVPAGWKVASDEDREAVDQEVKKFVDKAQVKFQGVAAFIFRPTEADFMENINVVVGAGGGNVNERAKEEYVKALTGRGFGNGVVARNMTVEIKRIGDRDALIGRYDVSMLGRQLRQMQAIFFVGGKAYTFTCTAQAADFPRYEPVFRQAIESVRIEGGLTLSPALRKALVGMVAGGLGGGLIGVIVWAARRRRQRNAQMEQLFGPPPLSP